MTYYINRRGNGYRETVDETDCRNEARAWVREYSFGDPTSEYYISSRACKGWREEETAAESAQ